MIQFAKKWKSAQEISLKDENFIDKHNNSLLPSVMKTVSEFKEMKLKMNSLNESCAVFGVPQLKNQLFQDIEIDVLGTEESYSFYSDFNERYHEIGQILWREFCQNLHELEEFAQLWSKKVKESVRSNPISGYIKKLTKDLIEAVPALVQCNGHSFRNEHWAELLQESLLLPPTINFENLQVHHFFSVPEYLLQPKFLTYMHDFA